MIFVWICSVEGNISPPPIQRLEDEGLVHAAVAAPVVVADVALEAAKTVAEALIAPPSKEGSASLPVRFARRPDMKLLSVGTVMTTTTTSSTRRRELQPLVMGLTPTGTRTVVPLITSPVS
jgi:hypothetical protein